MICVSWHLRLKSEEVIRRIGDEREILGTIRRGKMYWLERYMKRHSNDECNVRND